MHGAALVRGLIWPDGATDVAIGEVSADDRRGGFELGALRGHDRRVSVVLIVQAVDGFERLGGIVCVAAVVITAVVAVGKSQGGVCLARLDGAQHRAQVLPGVGAIERVNDGGQQRIGAQLAAITAGQRHRLHRVE